MNLDFIQQLSFTECVPYILRGKLYSDYYEATSMNKNFTG